MKQKTYMCDCGHREVQNEIHSVANHLDEKTLDICDECFIDASLIDTVESKFSSLQFTSLEDEKRTIN